MSQSQPTQEQTPPQEEGKDESQWTECEVCGKKVRMNMYKRHMSAVHGFITKEEYQRLKEEVEKTIQSTIHSALQEHWKGHYKSLSELLEEGEKHAETCPTCQKELEEWLKKKRNEKYKPANRKWL
ncbi:hypothetical protein c125 [Metallosphaera turreted icosahedral virus]|uniref:hypothetical protein c125 n=1 Tax=Metallosphaera turreted icosahedral virus TaxID=2023155 RepID=UPI000B8DBA31|nr:hypothetical protein c125 [Metallosphaera turreted icosahedral virus]ASO67387.1 hypothetical protein c125 [Metallosphaera turreted icosahedral virus]ASO67408.1 hypothetical protein c125 [Metallosphaera turreted icosahedral virus]